MNRILIFLCFILCFSSKIQGQSAITAPLYTNNLKKFKKLKAFKEALKDVEIISLGENTHGLGEVFKVKTELVKFLHKELGFNLVLFESGFGDAALALERKNKLSIDDYLQSFTSNYYYKSEEIKPLISYLYKQDENLKFYGFDCQPQQDYLKKRMQEIMQPIDSTFASTVIKEMNGFNKLYQHEYDKNQDKFNKQREDFKAFLARYNKKLDNNKSKILSNGTSLNEIKAIKKSIQIFQETYSNTKMGEFMGWPISANIRDASMFKTVQWYKNKYPKAKIIIWAQNSHIEKSPKPNNNVNWMGHLLRKAYLEKYYSIGAIVYSGRDLNYNGITEFKHNNPDFLAYHLQQYKKSPFILNLRNNSENSFLSKPLLGMESNGSLGNFIAKDRFDGLLFIEYSDIPKLIKKVKK